MSSHTLHIYDQNQMPIYTKLVTASYGQIMTDFPGPHEAEWASYYRLDGGPITKMDVAVKLKPDSDNITLRVRLDTPKPDIADAHPGDVYVDKDGVIWNIVGVINEPAVIARRMIVAGLEDHKHEKRVAGISGLLWDGFRRIYRSGE